MAFKNSTKQKWIQLFQHGLENNVILASSAGFGVFMGIIPLWGFQMLAAAIIAHFLRLNKPIVILFSNISIPVMIPFILFASAQIGHFLIEQKWLTVTLDEMSWEFCTQIIWYYLLGSVVLATICGILCFALVWLILRYGWRNRKAYTTKTDTAKANENEKRN